jgi:hypothetical protein
MVRLPHGGPCGHSLRGGLEVVSREAELSATLTSHTAGVLDYTALMESGTCGFGTPGIWIQIWSAAPSERQVT